MRKKAGSIRRRRFPIIDLGAGSMAKTLAASETACSAACIPTTGDNAIFAARIIPQMMTLLDSNPPRP